MKEISPGKVQNFSPRAVWLYRLRLDDLWASLYPASLPPAFGLTASSCSYGREFARRFFQLHLAATPCVSLRLPSSVPVGSFHPTRFCPCWAHWDALAAGLVDTVGTDHCPFDVAQKMLGEGNFTQIPNGIPGIEERVALMYTYGVKRRNLGIDRFVDALSTKPAKLFGLYPRKGTIAVGSDADLVIWDDKYRGKVTAAAQHANCDYSGFEGMEVEGRPAVVTVRGKVQVRDGVFTGERGRGRLLKRTPAYF